MIKKTQIKYYEGEDDNDPSFIDDAEYTVSVTRWFNIVGLTKDEFLDKVKEIDYERFEIVE